MNTLIKKMDSYFDQSNVLMHWASRIIDKLAPSATAQACYYQYGNCEPVCNHSCFNKKVCEKYCCGSSGCVLVGFACRPC